MLSATLCFLLQEEPSDKVLLGLKKIGFGAGKYAGIGGKIEAGETAAETAVRELKEEINVQADWSDLQKIAFLTFLFPHRPNWSQQVHVFCLHKWQGVIRESREIRPHWFPVGQIPFEQMWQDGRYWLPFVLNGQHVRATFTFAADNETVVKREIETRPLPPYQVTNHERSF